MNTAMRTPVHRSLENLDSLARKTRTKISISVPGEKEVVLADHREDVSASEAQVLLDLEDLTKTTVDKLAKITSEIKKLTEMMQSALMNDESYRNAADEVKKLTKERNKIKFEIMQQPANKQLADKIQELKFDKKELSGAQSDYLRELHRMSGSTQLELFDGTMMEMVSTYKLVKSSKK